MTIQETIAADIKAHKVVLFMKGTPDFPQCGFSAKVVHILHEHGATFHAINVLDDDEVRQGIKEYSSWPTIPQLYINGEFLGGCDIVTELDERDELAGMLA